VIGLNAWESCQALKKQRDSLQHSVDLIASKVKMDEMEVEQRNEFRTNLEKLHEEVQQLEQSILDLEPDAKREKVSLEREKQRRKEREFQEYGTNVGEVIVITENFSVSKYNIKTHKGVRPKKDYHSLSKGTECIVKELFMSTSLANHGTLVAVLTDNKKWTYSVNVKELKFKMKDIESKIQRLRNLIHVSATIYI
jgi:hypothetical protein